MTVQMQDTGIVPLSHWPGVTTNYAVSARDSGNASLDVRLTFAEAGVTSDAIPLYDVIIAQLDDPGTSIVLNCSLLADAEPMAAPMLSVWAGLIRAYLGTLNDGTPAPNTLPALVVSAALPFADLAACKWLEPVIVQVEQSRNGNQAETSVPPGVDGGFAENFEDAYKNRLKLAMADTPPHRLWAVRYGSDGVALETTDRPFYYAPAPLARQLVSGTISVRRYKDEWDGSDADFDVVQNDFNAIDLDSIAARLFTDLDAFLQLQLGQAAASVDAGSFADVLMHKNTIARAVAESIAPILQNDQPGDMLLAEARDALERAMQQSMATASSMGALVQIPIAVKTPSGATAVSAALYGSIVRGQDAGTGSSAKVALGAAVTSLNTAMLRSDATHQTSAVDFQIVAADSGLIPPVRALLLRPPTISLGDVDVPMPLRRVPAAAAIIGQSAVCNPDPATLPDALVWHYELEWTSENAAQDVAHITDAAQLFAPPAAAAASPMLQALGRYAYEAHSIRAHFTTIEHVADNPDAPAKDRAVAKAAIARFAELIAPIATAWSATPSAPASSAQAAASDVFRKRYILADQAAAASIWIERNAGLIEGQRTNQAFVYASAAVMPATPAAPFNDVTAAFSLDAMPGSTLTEKLNGLFATLFDVGDGVVIPGQRIDLNVGYSYEIMAGSGARVALPIGRSSVTLDERGKLPEKFLADVATICERWYKELQPSRVHAQIELDVAVFPAGAAVQPVLRLRSLTLSGDVLDDKAR